MTAGAVPTVLWTAFIVSVHELARRRLAGRRPHPLVSPFFVTIAAVAAAAGVTGSSASDVVDAGRPLTLALAPATVALGVRAAGVAHTIRRHARPLVVSVLAGGAVASGVAVGVAWLFGGPDPLRIPVSAHSITTPIALAVTAPHDADASLVAGMVVATGVVGAAVVPWLLNRLPTIGRPESLGLATGTVAHAIGTAEVARHDTLAGTLAGVALTVNGVGTAIWLPIVLAVLS